MFSRESCKFFKTAFVHGNNSYDVFGTFWDWLWREKLIDYLKFHGLINGTKYSRMDQVKFVEDSLQKISRIMVWLSRQNSLRFFKCCLPQILLGPFLNTLSQMFHCFLQFHPWDRTHWLIRTYSTHWHHLECCELSSYLTLFLFRILAFCV